MELERNEYKDRFNRRKSESDRGTHSGTVAQNFNNTKMANL